MFQGIGMILAAVVVVMVVNEMVQYFKEVGK